MTLTNIILIAAALLAVLIYVWIYFGAKRLYAAREARVEAQRRQAPPPETQAPAPAQPFAPAQPIAPPPPAPPPPAPPSSAPPPPASPFLGAPDGPPDDLSQIKGIGPKLSARLAELGVFHIRQIADWTPAQLAEVDAQLGNFQGRPERDQWQSQARLLASGDRRAYERAHGKLGATDAAPTPPPVPPPGDTPPGGTR